MNVLITCLGTVQGPRLLDGRTGDGSVGLAPHSGEPFSGTRWQMNGGFEGVVTLVCQGDAPGNRFLDGRTGDGTVGLAPTTDPPFTGTRWKVGVPIDDS
ncbi:hypothetical protein [Streptomyces sp. NRRL WC-3742]|uniref:hypothetical protein n=1 Tax=Streptomyces sp. NRRL WC-3742 TaxID=1463934 RepID=UPI0004C986E4|nr:hypothetical protein [Streptomyces sp. NRRL WC-3742]